MTIALRSANSFTEHAVCAAAGVRDGLRTAQFYVRDMANADGVQSASTHTPTFLSRWVGFWARGVDWFLSRAADISVRLLVPKWRELPSPFAPGMRAEVMEAIRQNRLVRTSLFTAYFFRAARHILERCTEDPHLVLEHRVDAARRIMAEESAITDGSPEAALANTLIHLVEADPIARLGAAKPGYAFMQQADANIAIMATACLALLLAEEGKPIENLDEDEFFAIAGALIAPRLPEMVQAIETRDVNSLAAQLSSVRNLY
jgi:hypothetical protein